MVYEGAYPDGLSHTVWTQDVLRLTVYDSRLRLKLQTDISDIPSTLLASRGEINRGVTKEEARFLARPRIMTPVH